LSGATRNPMNVGDARYIRLTTYTDTGQPRHVLVWATDLADGEVAFTTLSDSWKVKRIGGNPRVAIEASNMWGQVAVDTPRHTGTARVVEGTEFEHVRSLIDRKYRLELALSRLTAPILRAVGRGVIVPPTDRAVVVRLDS